MRRLLGRVRCPRSPPATGLGRGADRAALIVVDERYIGLLDASDVDEIPLRISELADKEASGVPYGPS